MVSRLLRIGPGSDYDDEELGPDFEGDEEGEPRPWDPLEQMRHPHIPIFHPYPTGGGLGPLVNPATPRAPQGLFARGFADAERESAPSAGRSGGLPGRLQLQPRAGGGQPSNNPGSSGASPSWDTSRPFSVPSQPSAVRPPLGGYGETPTRPTPSSTPPTWDPIRPFANTAPPSQARPPFVGNGDLPPQAAKDPDFRQLSRIPPKPLAPNGSDPNYRLPGPASENGNESPDARWAARKKAPTTQSPASTPGGGAGGSGDGDDPSASLDNRGGGRFDIYRRCMRTAKRDTQAWNDFCEDLDPDDRALWTRCNSHAFLKEPERKAFCNAEFAYFAD